MLPAHGKARREARGAAHAKLTGHYRPSRHGHGNPQPPDGTLVAPSWLTPQQRRRFVELVELQAANIFRPVDETALAAVVVAESMLIEATKARRRRGQGGIFGVDSKGRPMTHPLVTAQIRALKALRPFLDACLLSPGSRNNVKLPADEDGLDDGRWARFDALRRAATPRMSAQAALELQTKRRMKSVPGKGWMWVDADAEEEAEIVELKHAGPLAAAVEPEPGRIVKHDNIMLDPAEAPAEESSTDAEEAEAPAGVVDQKQQ
jgi:phage terminase small subunit